MNPAEPTCDEIEALLPLVADGALDEQADPALFAHLSACERCQESLAAHDLVTIALEQPRAPLPKVLRPTWRRSLPLAAAAMLAIGVTGWVATRPAAEAAPAATVVAAAAPAAAAPIAKPKVAPEAPAPVVAAAPTAPFHIDVEVVAMPGSTTAHPHYLVRKGDQVLLVDPVEATQEAPADAKPASYAPPRRY